MERNAKMGRFTTKIIVSNNRDVQMADGGALSPDKIRSTTIDGVVDSGAAHLVLPESVVTRLGLKQTGTATVRHADRRTATRAVVGQVQVEIQGRQGTFHALVEPARDTAFIGAIVMEDLDLLVDCVSQQLLPRDPKGIVSEVE